MRHFPIHENHFWLSINESETVVRSKRFFGNDYWVRSWNARACWGWPLDEFYFPHRFRNFLLFLPRSTTNPRHYHKALPVLPANLCILISTLSRKLWVFLQLCRPHCRPIISRHRESPPKTFLHLFFLRRFHWRFLQWIWGCRSDTGTILMLYQWVRGNGIWQVVRYSSTPVILIE